jgi:hypothetical protein
MTDEQDPDDKVFTKLSEARFWKELVKGKYPALNAGYRPAEELAARYLAGGYSHDEMLHAMVYSAAAQLFRDLPRGQAEAEVRLATQVIIEDLLRNGPHYGHEEY